MTPYGVTLDELNRYLKALYHADWEDPRGVIRLNSGLRLEEANRAVIFRNARIFLKWLDEVDGSPLTATGNLTRSSVAQLFDRLELEAPYRESIRFVCKVVNEQDVWPLHEVRLLAEHGKLTARRNKRITLSKLGREYLEDARAGELFRRLFLTYFRTMNLCYLVHVREIPEIQSSLAIILWRLEQVAEDWRDVKGIGQQILPPKLTAHIQALEYSEFNTPDWFVSCYVLQPLREFGLLEVAGKEGFHVDEKDRVRLTPLFRRFISFNPIASSANN